MVGGEQSIYYFFKCVGRSILHKRIYLSGSWRQANQIERCPANEG